MSTGEFTLTDADRAQLVRHLGELQTYVECAIDSVIVEGETEACDPDDQPGLDEDRATWKEAEAWVARLSDGLLDPEEMDGAA